jgi:hypothetical protein
MGAYESGTAVPLGNFAYQSQVRRRRHGNGQFTAPSALRSTPPAATSSWSMRSGNRVQIFNSAGVYVSSSVARQRPGQFATPLIAAIDRRPHNIVVTDSGNRRVQIFSSSGVF